jgi:hypothetical protein
MSFESEDDRPGPQATGSGWPGERERLLAAVGWKEEPRRRKVLRDLLREHHQRIYLFSYADGRSRAAAMEQARRILLRIARSLDQIPEGSTLSAWIFLSLLTEADRNGDCQDPWRMLSAAETGTPRTRETAPREDGAALERHLEAHPQCRALRDRYRAYLGLPLDPDLVTRARWDQAEVDLDHFLNAQFGDEHPAALSGGPSWRHLLPSLAWGRSRAAGAIVVVIALVLAGLLWRAWHVHKDPGWNAPDSGRASEAISQAVAKVNEPSPASIADPRLLIERDALIFLWNHFEGAEEYQVELLTPKLDVLYNSGTLTQPHLRVNRSAVDGLKSGGPYLYRISGMKNGAVIASTGYTPFTAP